MKRLILLLALSLPSVAWAQDGDPDQRARDFRAATERALSGDLAEAISLYEHLEQSGVKHPDLWYNLGTTYARAGMLVDAAVSFERVLRLDPGDEDARANLQSIRTKLRPASRGEDGQVATGLIDLIEPFVSPWSQDGAAWTLLILDAVFFSLLILGRVWRRSRRAAAIIAAPVLIALLVTTLVVIGQELVRRDHRAVATKTTDLKEGPHPRFGATGGVYAGERLRLGAEESGWVEAQNELGQRGWIAEQDLARF